MAVPRFAWGIDIGNRALKAIKLVQGDAGLRIDDFEVIEHESVLSNAGDNRESLIQSALQTFVQRHQTKGGVAAISVSGVSSFARFIKLPPVETKKIPEIVRFEAIQQIPFPLDDVEWAYQLFQAPDSPEVEVGIFAMRKDLINRQIQFFTDVDLNVQVVQMNPLAVYNAMRHDNRLTTTTMMIDLGAENTDLIIADGESVWLRSIPIGGNNFTEVLVKSFKLSFAKAEELKRNANTSKYARQIFQAMRPVFADLVAEIQRSIGFYSSVHREARIQQILALGGTFRLAGLQKYLQQNLQIEVAKINELAGGGPTDPKEAANFNQNLLSLVSAYGLGVQAMGQSTITSNLLPRQIRRETMWRGKTKWFGAAAACFVAGTAVAIGGYYTRDLNYKQNQSIRGNNQSVLDQARSLDSSWKTQVESVGGDDRTRIVQTRAMFDGRDRWTLLPTDIFSALPKLPAAYASGNVAAIKATPRDQRRIIQINRLNAIYSPDILASLTSGIQEWNVQAAGQPGQSGPNGQAATVTDPDIPTGSRGYLFMATLTTPHNNGYLFVLNTFNANLQKLNRDWMDAQNARDPKDERHYYVAKVFAPRDQMQLRDDQTRLQELTTSYADAMQLEGNNNPSGAPSVSTNRPPMPPMYGYAQPGAFQPQTMGNANPNDAAAMAAAIAPFRDRLTGEDMRDDWEMKVIFVVIIDPPPKGAAAPAAGGA